MSKTDAGVGSPPRGRIPAGCDGLGPIDITGVVWLAEGPGPGGGHGNQPEKGPRGEAPCVRCPTRALACRGEVGRNLTKGNRPAEDGPPGRPAVRRRERRRDTHDLGGRGARIPRTDPSAWGRGPDPAGRRRWRALPRRGIRSAMPSGQRRETGLRVSKGARGTEEGARRAGSAARHQSRGGPQRRRPEATPTRTARRRPGVCTAGRACGPQVTRPAVARQCGFPT